MQTQTLRVGEKATLRTAFFRAGHGVIYAGMVSDSVYSLVFTYSAGHQAMAFNLFFSESQRDLTFQDWRLTILDLRPDYISLRIDKAV